MMSTVPIEHTVRDPTDDAEVPENLDPAAILELLADDRSIALFRTAVIPLTVEELARHCEVPLSTAYRKVDELEDAGLLERIPSAEADAAVPDRFIRGVDRVEVTLEDGIHVTYFLSD